MKKKLQIIIIFLVFIGGIFIYLFNNTLNKNTIELKEQKEVITKHYNLYKNKNIDLYNQTVDEKLKINLNTEEEKQYNKLFLEDIVDFKLVSVDKIIPNIPESFVEYSKENLVFFKVSYDIDFNKNIYGTGGEGKFESTVTLGRKDTNSPWVIIKKGDGHGY